MLSSTETTDIVLASSYKKKDNDTALHLNLTPGIRKKEERAAVDDFLANSAWESNNAANFSARLYNAIAQSKQLREEKVFHIQDSKPSSEKWNDSSTPSGEIYRSGISGYQSDLGLQRIWPLQTQ